MKKQHIMMIGTLTLCGSLLVAVPSSFAVKSMDDKEMDRTTAAGQPRVDIGNGQQTIDDGSLYSVSIGLGSQSAIVGDSAVNVAGENNIAVGVNVANVDGGGSVDQINNFDQQRNSQVTIAAPTTGAGLTWLDGTVSSTAGGTESGDISVNNITVSADHIHIGHGDQTENDTSTYSVDIQDTAQADAAVLSLVNAAGRNNVAVGLNAANGSYATFGVTGGAIAISQLNSFTQTN